MNTSVPLGTLPAKQICFKLYLKKERKGKGKKGSGRYETEKMKISSNVALDTKKYFKKQQNLRFQPNILSIFKNQKRWVYALVSNLYALLGKMQIIGQDVLFK